MISARKEEDQPEIKSFSTLILNFSASRTIKYQYLLFKLLSMCYFVTASWADYYRYLVACLVLFECLLLEKSADISEISIQNHAVRNLQSTSWRSCTARERDAYPSPAVPSKQVSKDASLNIWLIRIFIWLWISNYIARETLSNDHLKCLHTTHSTIRDNHKLL
jgi:hypothetical protein